MSYIQHIPFYIHEFENFPWKKYESEHYIFYVEESSLAEKEIEDIKSRQEAAFSKIVGVLGLKAPEQKITYYFYSSCNKKKDLMGDGCYGQSIYNEFTVHAVYNNEDKVIGEHEDTHLLMLQVGYPVSFFQEGIAEAMVGRSMFGNEHNRVVQKGLNKGLKIDLEYLISTQQAWLDTPDEESEFYYSVAGSFIAYLLGDIGVERYKRLYGLNSRDHTSEENVKIFEEIVKKNIQILEKEWIKMSIPSVS